MKKIKVKAFLKSFRRSLLEACVRTGVDKKVIHRGSGDQKRSYIQVTTTDICDDNFTTPTEQAAKQSAIEKKRKALQKKQAQRGKEWRRDKDRQKKALASPLRTP